MAGDIRYMYLCSVTRLAVEALGEIVTSLARSRTGRAALTLAVLDGPMTPITFRLAASFWAAATAFFGCPSSSRSSTRTWRPSTPPALFRSATASSAPSLNCIPCSALLPVSGAITPITSSCAVAAAATPSASPSPTAIATATRTRDRPVLRAPRMLPASISPTTARAPRRAARSRWR